MIRAAVGRAGLVWAVVVSAWMPAIASQAEDAAPRWRVVVTANPVKGGTIGIASMATPEVRATVRCESADGWIDVRFHLDERLTTTTREVAWQFDGEAVRTQSWRASPNRGSLIVPMESHADFIEQLRQRRSLMLTLRNGEGGESAFEIPLRGSADAIDDALQACS